MTKHSSGNRKGVGVDGFIGLVDELVLLYKSVVEATSELHSEDNNNNNASAETEENEETEDEREEAVMEVDTVATFDELSAGKGFATLEVRSVTCSGLYFFLLLFCCLSRTKNYYIDFI